MSDLETLLREHFSAEADAAPTNVDLRGGVDSLRGRRRHHRFLSAVAAVAAAVIATAIAVPLALVGGGRPHGLATVSPAISANGPAARPSLQPVTPAPPGQRAVTWAGIQFFVPAGWTTVPAYGCPYVTTVGEVSYPYYGPNNAVFNCPSIPPIRHESLVFSAFGAVPNRPAGSPVPVAGHLAGLPATVSHTVVDGQASTSVIVPTLLSAFTVTTNTEVLGEAILASAHRVTVDENGCAVQQPVGLQPVRGGGPGGPQVTGTPVSGVVCAYADGRLRSGVTLAPEQLQALASALNALPAGDQSAHGPQNSAQLSPDGELAWIVLTNASGRTQQITVQSLSQHHVAGVAGATQSALSAGLFYELVNDLPTSFGGDVPYVEGSLPGPLYGAP